MAFKRVYHRANFDTNMSEQDKLDCIDDFYKECGAHGVDGVIIGRGSGTTYILEGDDAAVDGRVSSLQNNGDLTHNETIHTDNSGSSSGTLVSHSDDDKRMP